MSRFSPFLLIVAILGLLAGCTPDPHSGKGFTLPPGDAERGKQSFVELQCNACHTVKGVSDIAAMDDTDQPTVALGGEKGFVVTYGELVTAIINPSHRFATGYPSEDIKDESGESKMRHYNDEMTVTELINLVTFLEQHYEVEFYQPTPYVPFY